MKNITSKLVHIISCVKFIKCYYQIHDKLGSGYCNFAQILTVHCYYLKKDTRNAQCSSRNNFLDMKNIGKDTLLVFLAMLEQKLCYFLALGRIDS